MKLPRPKKNIFVQIKSAMSHNTLLYILLILHFVYQAISQNSSDILYEVPPFIRVYKNGTIERLGGTAVVPPSIDPITGVNSKDVLALPSLNLSARIFLPKNANPINKLPLLIFFHGGAFFTESASSPIYHNHLNALVASANVVAVSLNYRLAPEYPLPTGYDDSWLGVKWVFSHFKGNGSEPWIRDYADFGHVYLGGDSAGANIAHNMAIRVGLDKTDGRFMINGLFLNCPHFWGKTLIGNELDPVFTPVKNVMEGIWIHAYPNSTGFDDPLLNPVLDPNLSGLGTRRVLVIVAENDVLRWRGWLYRDGLVRSGWKGSVHVLQVKGEDHDFGVRFPTRQRTMRLLRQLAQFMNYR